MDAIFGTIEWPVFTKAALGLFAVLNPFYVMPVLGGLVTDCDEREKRFLFRTSSITASVIVLVMGVVGEFMMQEVFQVRNGSMLIAGGALLFIVALRNMIAGATEEEKSAEQASNLSDHRRGQLISRAVSPMAFPVLVGPGSMIAAILVVKELGIAQGILAILFACGTLVLVMSYAHILLRRAGRIAPVVISRILMVFVAGLGVEFIYRGIVFLFPAIMG